MIFVTHVTVLFDASTSTVSRKSTLSRKQSVVGSSPTFEKEVVLVGIALALHL